MKKIVPFKKDIELKNRIRMNSYDILELSYIGNNATDIEYKKEVIQKIIAKVKIIDFLINLSYDKQIITAKKYYKIANKIDDIVRYTTGWLKNI